jgi:hypothetical protein
VRAVPRILEAQTASEDAGEELKRVEHARLGRRPSASGGRCGHGGPLGFEAVFLSGGPCPARGGEWHLPDRGRHPSNTCQRFRDVPPDT